jgi:hypothetical protein
MKTVGSIIVCFIILFAIKAFFYKPPYTYRPRPNPKPLNLNLPEDTSVCERSINSDAKAKGLSMKFFVPCRWTRDYSNDTSAATVIQQYQKSRGDSLMFAFIVTIDSAAPEMLIGERVIDAKEYDKIIRQMVYENIKETSNGTVIAFSERLKIDSSLAYEVPYKFQKENLYVYVFRTYVFFRSYMITQSFIIVGMNEAIVLREYNNKEDYFRALNRRTQLTRKFN